MGQILGPIGDALNSFLNNQNVQLAGRAIALYVVLLWLASAYWAYRDLQSRTSNPIAPYLAAVVMVLFTPILFPFGILLYRLVRPGETVAEANERAIAEEAMLREIEAQPHCANCDRRVEAEWLICPTCRNQLRRMCPACNRRVELDWVVCAWCGAELSVPMAAASRPPASARRRTARTDAVPASAVDPLQATLGTTGLDQLRTDQRRPDQQPAGGAPLR